MREQGWAASHAERDEGVSAVAVPVRTSNGKCIAALSISGPTSRFSRERINEFAAALKQTAAVLESRSGSPLNTQHIVLSNLNHQGDKT